jgi:hypothetical protein
MVIHTEAGRSCVDVKLVLKKNVGHEHRVKQTPYLITIDTRNIRSKKLKLLFFAMTRTKNSVYQSAEKRSQLRPGPFLNTSTNTQTSLKKDVKLSPL